MFDILNASKSECQKIYMVNVLSHLNYSKSNIVMHITSHIQHIIVR